MKALITGGTGFLGQRLSRKLLEKGMEVHVFARKPFQSDDVIFQSGNIRNEAEVQRAVYRIKPDWIFHLAADLRRAREAELYRDLMSTNVIGTLNLLSAASDLSNLSAFVSAGSFEEYGRAPVPFEESGPIVPVSPYGESKASATLAVAGYGNGIIPAVALRFPVVYGEGQTQVSFMTRIKQAYDTGEIFQMSPGDQTRDFLHVGDAVGALVRSAEYIERCRGEIINICRSEEISMLNVGRLIEEITGRKDLVKFGATKHRENEQMRYVGSNQKMKEILGFKPSITLEEGIRQVFCPHA